MNKFLFLATTVCMLFVFPARVLSVGLPPPPSKETLDKLKQMGDENLQKYGDGGVTLVNGEYVISTKAPPVLPTNTPVPTLVPTATPTPMPTLTPTPQPVPVVVMKKTQTIFASVWQFFSRIFGSSKGK
jgi:hypothetical protein